MEISLAAQNIGTSRDPQFPVTTCQEVPTSLGGVPRDLFILPRFALASGLLGVKK